MPKILEMWAYVAEDTGPDDEGIISAQMGGIHMPLVGADRERMESLRDHAEMIARMFGKPVKLLRFTMRQDMGTI